MTTNQFSIDKSINISHVIYVLFLLGGMAAVWTQTQAKLEVHSTQINALQDGLKASDIRADQRSDRTDDKIDALRNVVETRMSK